ncbi:MAG: N-methyl-L-tryptophan oxidase [Armatimonadota bacterium]|nr:N-methyl-L-tryptophan oxidase [Armatimonadota bacterium]
MPFDVIVLGLGGMGSAAAYHLARRGARVLGLDRHAPAHDLGASHGRSRIIREAYFEHPSYVPLVHRAYDLWADLERASNQRLLRTTGGIMIGAPSTALVQGALQSARQHHLRHEVLDAPEIRRRFPVFHPTDEMIGVYEPRAGVLDPEACVRTHLDQAARAGAELHHEEQVLSWHASATHVRVETSRGRYDGGRLVVTAGPWAPALLADLGLPLVIERQIIGWFRPAAMAEAFAPGRCPVYLWQIRGRFFYGFPELDGHGVKIAEHAVGDPTTADAINRAVAPEEIDELRRHFIARYLPAANGAVAATGTCMYTMTPDTHFVIDDHPRHANVVIACGFSGHGFKFAPVVGEMLADLATGGTTRYDIRLFAIGRFVRAG